MNKTFRVPILFLILGVVVFTACPPPPPPGPMPQYVDYISPPGIRKPIYDGTEIIAYTEGTAGYRISVYANDTEFLGEGRVSPWGWGAVKVSRPLKMGDKITATQSRNGDTGHPTWPKDAVTVGKIPVDKLINGEKLYPPKVIGPIYDCQRGAWVENLIDGVQVTYEISNTTTESGNLWTPYPNAFIVPAREFKESQKFRAKQNIPSAQESEYSSGETVQPKPSSLNDAKYKPEIIKDVDNDGRDDISVGTTLVTICNLITGAVVDIYSVDASDTRTRIGGGIAGGNCTLFPVKPLTTDNIVAEQALCELKSPPSDPVMPKNTIGLPEIEEPICAGATKVTVHKTELGTYVEIEVNGKPRGGATAPGGTTNINIGGGVPLAAGDKVTVRQSNASLKSGWTKAVTVSGPMNSPIVKVENGHPFFNPEAGEQAILGQVFLRGVNTTGMYGPVFKMVMCGASKAVVYIIDPKGENIETIPLGEIKTGYFEGGWDWKHANWKIPDDIPVGEYKARFEVTSSAGVTTSEQIFYVIFNPGEVTAPSRFAFNETGIWFGPDWGSDEAITYELHPDDKRVFSLPIKQINGETNQYSAAKKLLNFENGMFTYSESWHCGNQPCDVIHLIETETAAQCADDANMLTVLLRSVGIPSHPVTADAGVEYAGAGWNFDTWVEARMKGPHGERWYVLHPHQGSGIGPDKRVTVGAGVGLWSLATKFYNDLVIMANEDWISSEVTDDAHDVEFGYNTTCNEPEQTFTKKANWVEHLCMNGPTGDGYWSKGHWECSPSFSPDIRIRLDRESYHVGDTMHIVVTIRNQSEAQQTDRMELNIAVDHPFTKIFPDIKLEVGHREINIPPRDSAEIEFEYKLPLYLSSADGYTVRASFGEEFGAAPFSVKSLYVGRLVIPDQATVGKPFTTELIIENTSDRVIDTITVKLWMPFGVKTREGSAEQRILTLKPDESRTLRWELYAEVPSEAAGFVLEIKSGNGGNAVLRRGLVVQPAR